MWNEFQNEKNILKKKAILSDLIKEIKLSESIMDIVLQD